MFLFAIRDGALADLSDIILSMHERDFILKEAVQILEAR